MTKVMANQLRQSAVPYVERIHDPMTQLNKKSYFLLGPRQTGKTFLIRRRLEKIKVYDLLDTSVYLALSQNPGRIEQGLSPAGSNRCYR